MERDQMCLFSEPAPRPKRHPCIICFTPWTYLGEAHAGPCGRLCAGGIPVDDITDEVIEACHAPTDAQPCRYCEVTR